MTTKRNPEKFTIVSSSDYTKFRFSGRLKKYNTVDQFLDITEGELVFKNFTFGK